MKRNSRLSLALHTLGHMASEPERVRTSADIADHAGTNAVVVRRVLGKLRDAGLLTSEKGHAGGWRLAKPPHRITLADVYLALGESLVSSGVEVEGSSCSIERALHRRVTAALEDIERTLIERLASTTIAEVRETGDVAHS
ncbi:MAG: Rrf2 family transcriptional regulator [Pseudomonadota bacterium]